MKIKLWLVVVMALFQTVVLQAELLSANYSNFVFKLKLNISGPAPHNPSGLPPSLAYVTYVSEADQNWRTLRFTNPISDIDLSADAAAWDYYVTIAVPVWHLIEKDTNVMRFANVVAKGDSIFGSQSFSVDEPIFGWDGYRHWYTGGGWVTPTDNGYAWNNQNYGSDFGPDALTARERAAGAEGIFPLEWQYATSGRAPMIYVTDVTTGYQDHTISRILWRMLDNSQGPGFGPQSQTNSVVTNSNGSIEIQQILNSGSEGVIHIEFPATNAMECVRIAPTNPNPN